VDIFISHTWKNKTLADTLAFDLADVGTVWIDDQQTESGGGLSPELFEGIERAEAFLLIWSRQAKKSQRVKTEITLAMGLDIPVIPCLIDDKKLPKKLRKTPAIPFLDYDQGLGRLNLALFKIRSAELGLDLGGMPEDSDWDGVIAFLQRYREEIEASGEEAFWIERVLASSQTIQASADYPEQSEEGAAYARSLMERIETVGEDPEKLREILLEVIRNEDKAPEMLGKIRVMLEQMLDMLAGKTGVSEPTGAAPQPVAPQKVSQMGTSFRGQEMAGAADDPREQLRQHLQGRVPDNDLEAIIEYLFYYNEAAAPSLDALANVSQARGSAAGVTVVQHLLQYLGNPDDLLPESSYGYFGYIDDAWLIHNTAYRLVEAGILPPQTFGVEWQNITAADGLVRQLLPPAALSQLENMLMQFLQIIAAEIQNYQPQFAGGAGGNHPYMGGQSEDDRWMDVMTDSLNYL